MILITNTKCMTKPPLQKNHRDGDRRDQAPHETHRYCRVHDENHLISIERMWWYVGSLVVENIKFAVTHRAILNFLARLRRGVTLVGMPRDPFIREKFTRVRPAARALARGDLERAGKDRYQTEIESWRDLQADNVEFTMKRLREPLED